MYPYKLITSTADPLSSLMDKQQNMDIWQEYFNEPTGSNMGRLQAMYAIGSIVSMPFAPFVADRWGRKASIVLGCSIMIIASALQTSATGQPMYEGRLQKEFQHRLKLTWSRRSILPRFWQFIRSIGLSTATYRDLSSAAPCPCDCCLQLPVARWIHPLRLADLWHQRDP